MLTKENKKRGGAAISPMQRTIYNKGKTMYNRNKNNSFSGVLKKQFA